MERRVRQPHGATSHRRSASSTSPLRTARIPARGRSCLTSEARPKYSTRPRQVPPARPTADRSVSTPWFTQNADGSFSYGVDYPTTANDFGEVSQFAQQRE